MINSVTLYVTKINTSNEFNKDTQIKWEFLKYEIRNLRLITQVTKVRLI